MKQAQMIFHRKNDIKGNPEQITVEWDGPKDGVVKISSEFMDCADLSYLTKEPRRRPIVGDVIAIGPYRLKIFEFDYDRWQYHTIRVDSWLGQFQVIVYRLTRWVDLIYRRLIITAAVWRLADYHEIDVPSWKDLYIVKRFKNK